RDWSSDVCSSDLIKLFSKLISLPDHLDCVKLALNGKDFQKASHDLGDFSSNNVAFSTYPFSNTILNRFIALIPIHLCLLLSVASWSISLSLFSNITP